MAKSSALECKSFFFVGIGGVSMSALAKMLVETGKKVAGYDRVEGYAVRALKKIGIEVTDDLNVRIDDFECIVYTDAVLIGNKILRSAERLNKTIISRGELLAEISTCFPNVISVAGCHGKTTCTAMIAHIFLAAKMNFCVHMGGFDNRFGNFFQCGNDYFITEACEFKRNFLLLEPTVAVVLNRDVDHLDCYDGVEDLKKSYCEFARRSPISVGLYADGVNASLSFGLDDRADYYAKKLRQENGKYSFVAYEFGCMLGTVRLETEGKHNVLNALAAIAVARNYGIDFGAIQRGLSDFNGIKRRFERIGKIGNAVCVADYAHHPNEIKASLKTARLVTQGDLYVVFQPHTYSRTKLMFKQFVNVLSSVKKLMIYKTYAAREYYDDAGSALTLSNKLKRSQYADCVDDIVDFTKNCKDGDVVLVLGAGDIYDVVKSLV